MSVIATAKCAAISVGLPAQWVRPHRRQQPPRSTGGRGGRCEWSFAAGCRLQLLFSYGVFLIVSILFAQCVSSNCWLHRPVIVKVCGILSGFARAGGSSPRAAPAAPKVVVNGHSLRVVARTLLLAASPLCGAPSNVGSHSITAVRNGVQNKFCPPSRPAVTPLLHDNSHFRRLQLRGGCCRRRGWGSYTGRDVVMFLSCRFTTSPGESAKLADMSGM